MDLKQQFLGGVAWTSISRLSIQFLNLGVMIVLARLLDPAVFGLMAMVTVFSGLAVQIQDLGVGHALIQRSAVTKENIQVAFTIALFGSLVIYVLLYLSAPLVGLFYGNNDVVIVLRYAAIVVPLSALSVVPKAMLRRNLTVRGQSVVVLVTSVVSSSATVMLAWLGAGVWSFVAGNLINACMTAIGLFHVAPWSIRLRIRGGEFKEIFRFGGGVSLSGLLWYGYSNLYFLIIGRILGTRSLGIYQMAWDMAKMPWERLWGVLNPLILPLFSRSGSHPEDLRRVLLKLTHYMAFIILPMVAGLGLVVEDAIPVLLGEKWTGAVNPIRWLCIYGAVRGIVVLLPPVLIAVGRVRSIVNFNIMCFLFLPPAFWIGAGVGPVGPAMAWALIYPVIALVMLMPKVLAVTGLTIREYLASLWRPSLATCAMMIVVILLGGCFPGHEIKSVAVKIISGIIVYMVVVRLLLGSMKHTIIEMIASTRTGMSR